MSFTPFPNEIYTIFSFLGFIMCIILLPCHLKGFTSWNTGTCLLMFWAGMGCLIFFVNSIVWHGNVSNNAPIWCDICVKIIVGTFNGIPASSLCINRRLYVLQLDPAGSFVITKSDKIRSFTIDLGISFALPIVFMALHYVHQGHRFDIFEDIGCIPNSYNTWVTILLLNIPPVILGLVSATYGICSMISINKKRNQLNDLLAHRQNITSNLYFRLMCYAGIEALTTTPIAVYFVVVDMKIVQFYPWISWEESHLGVHDVGRYPATEWHNFPFATAYEFIRWIHVISAFMFFFVFGFAEEAKSHYRHIIKFLLKFTEIRIGRQIRPHVSQSDPARHLTFSNERPSRADFSIIPVIPKFSGCGRIGEEQRPPSGTVLCDTQDCTGDLGGRSQSHPHAPVAVEQENERMPSRTIRSFLNLGHSSTYFENSELDMDISTIEGGRPSRSNRHSNNQLSRPFRSFLNLT